MKVQLGIVLALVVAITASAVADELDFSQFKGKSYDAVKHDSFLAKGWEIVPNEEDESSFSRQYPEVTCGSGSMEICSVGSRHEHHSVAFVVIGFSDELIVSEEY
ncbi:hypothetical protein EK599_10490 [Vibrio sp. T187]|uniref:hypothetical protein n=1 Tax=Vibrio TaxID=662 RepID=UPI0010C95E0B|nr:MULTISPECIES: hypothetical protein [Vibrio]MBW3696127.1 hypothetical protein [Vibrio sp. T187]